MARLHLDRFRAHPLGHEALQVGIDRPILGGDRIKAGFDRQAACFVLPASSAL